MILSGLDDVMKQHIAHIVHEEHRPFSYQDFLHFEVDGMEYNMTHGTFRNKVSRLVKEGIVELSYSSGLAFYTLKGIKFGKPMTADHTGVASYSHPIARIIRNLPFEKAALHDIHLRFDVRDCWALLSGCPFEPHPVSKDIRLPLFAAAGLRARITVHKTDTVTVVVGCSPAPIAVDLAGIIRLSNALTRVEERLARILEDSSKISVAGLSLGQAQSPAVIPDHKDWIVTMWHFGADASIEFTGERFSASWEVGQQELIRVYSKEFRQAVNEYGNSIRYRKKTKVRVEMQQYPLSTVEHVINNIIQREDSAFIHRLG
jgi:hypothetical protein